MPSQFLALPVGQGDAFLYERDDRRALVDGGKSASRIVYLIAKQSIEHIDVLVCTHNDKDHAEGIAGLLESDSVEVAEVWLPGRWSQRIVDLCRASGEFLEELEAQVADSGAQTLEVASREPSGERARSGQAERSNARGRTDRETLDDAAFQQIHDAIDAIDERDIFRWRWAWSPGRIDAQTWNLWVDCLAAAARIRRIARAARDVGARIRWFDFAEFAERSAAFGGIQGFLVPVNAFEITPRIVKKRVSAFDYLRLSVANRESLVFHAPGASQDADILFTADSDLAFDLPTMRAAIVTSPHHGSDANKVGYAKVQGLGCQATWVRSDGRFQTRPGKTFLSYQTSAYCTRCRGSTAQGQAIRAHDKIGTGGSPTWVFHPSTRPCHCLP